MVALCERGVSGTFNATNEGVTWEELLETCRAVTGANARVTWVSDDFLVEHEVGQWMELPLWLAEPEMAAANDAIVRRAVAAGLRFRPLTETVRATLELAEPTDDAGLAPEREADLLADWHGRG
jgi:2'-hydroxyisoflavone reductase